MRENFEIEKELKFTSNVAEITSISLEEKHEIENKKLKGNFIVSGDYRIHEISINKEKFNFKIPFEHNIKNDIDPETIDLEITDFIYDTDNDSLYATINYDLTGERKDILLFDDEENLEEFLKSREVEIIMDDTIEKIDEAIINQEEKSKIEENKEDKQKEILELPKEIKETSNEIKSVEEVQARNMEETKQQLLNSVNLSDDNYITYQIHIVKSEDTTESILMKYNITIDELKEYNDFNVLQLGDKLIIPSYNEE